METDHDNLSSGKSPEMDDLERKKGSFQVASLEALLDMNGMADGPRQVILGALEHTFYVVASRTKQLFHPVSDQVCSAHGYETLMFVVWNRERNRSYPP